MGKKLIIKGADFSANGISFPINITELITTFVDGINGVVGNSNESRKAIYPRFSIESYRQAGYSKISVSVKSLGCYPFLTSVDTGRVSSQNVVAFDSNVTYLNKEEYTLDLEQVDPTHSYIYFGLNIDKELADISSNNLSDYIDIEMSKA